MAISPRRDNKFSWPDLESGESMAVSNTGN